MECKLQKATIKGSLYEWQIRFLGTDDNGKPKTWSVDRFRQRVLGISIKELGEFYPKIIFYLIRLSDIHWILPQ